MTVEVIRKPHSQEFERELAAKVAVIIREDKERQKAEKAKNGKNAG